VCVPISEVSQIDSLVALLRSYQDEQYEFIDTDLISALCV
jgi:hypothetical protein